MKNNEERVNSIMKKVELYRRKRGQIISTVTIGVCMALLVAAGVNINGYKKVKIAGENDTSVNSVEEITSKEGELLAFSSKEELVSMFEESAKKYQDSKKKYFTNGGSDLLYDGVAVAETSNEMPNSINFNAIKSTTRQSDEAETSDSNYSETNVQTKGVDESDIIKTDGKRIYYMNSERKDVKIFEDVNNEIKLIKTIALSNNKEDYSYGDSMFLDDKHLIVIAHGSKRMNDEAIAEEVEAINSKKMISYMPYRTKTFTEIYIYDVNTYDLIRKVEAEGNLVSSRKIGDNLYLVSNKYIYYYDFRRDDIMPLYKDTLESQDYCEVEIENIRGFKDFEKEEQCNYMIITSLNLADSNSKVNIETYLGAGTEIYCSTDHLYVTKANYHYSYRGPIAFYATVDAIAIDDSSNSEVKTSTNIHKFAIKDGKTTYVATGKVNGTLLNQFSMDEYDKNFRITTTDDKGNKLYVLDESLKQIGSLENLASGERIYSTRFMGDKAYVVTYKTVDPLFVIDLKNPSAPKVLGELKIPGYSSYLHPIGKNYLLGFGEDSVEKSYINWEGKQELVAYATGLKMAIFDVSDYSNPKEIHNVKIGGRGSYSELLYNHKALLLDESKKIFAFPVSVTKEAGYYEDGTPMYGDIDFAGALVYNMDVENGFSLKGKITHESENRYSKYGNIERIIYIGDKFYTVSNGMIKSTNMDTMQEVSKLKF
ncbi:MAG: beta-propeller domain-containing protein [Clostridia bacterium]|nr:beta-propeller domain-containing protein [Clostridia bacterium]